MRPVPGWAASSGTTELSSVPSVTSARSIGRVARGSTVNLVGAAASAMCAFALTVVVARGLSRADAGVFFSATSIFLVATAVGQLGTQTGLVYFVARCRAQGRSEDIDEYLRIALRPVIVLGVAMAAIVLVFAHPLAALTSPRHGAQATTYLQILAPFIPVAVVEAALLSATRGLGSMRASALIEQVARPLVQLLLVIAATAAASTVAISFAWSCAYAPAAAAAWIAWRRLRATYVTSPPMGTGGRHRSGQRAQAIRQDVPRRPDIAPPGHRLSRRDHVTVAQRAASSARPTGVSKFVDFWRFSVPRALTGLILMMLQRFDVVLVGALSGVVNAAVYAAATRFVVVGQFGVNALTLAAQPQLAEKFAVGDRDAANEVYQVSTAWLILVTWPLYLTFILFAKPLLLVFGSGYSGGQSAMLIVSLSMLVATGLGMVDTVLSMAGHTSWNLANAALALSVNLVLNFWLIPTHGIVGAAIAWAAAIVVRNVAAVTLVGVSLRYHPFARSTATAAFLALGCYLVISGLVLVMFGPSVTGLAVALVVATICFVAGCWSQRAPLRLDSLIALRGRR